MCVVRKINVSHKTEFFVSIGVMFVSQKITEKKKVCPPKLSLLKRQLANNFKTIFCETVERIYLSA